MSSRERNLLIALVVLAAAGAVYFFLFVMGGEEPAEQAAPTPAASPPAVPAEPGTGVGEPPAEPPRAVSFLGGRDPFVPLVVAAEGAGGTGTTSAETATESTATTSTTGTTGTTATTGETVEEPAATEGETQEVTFTGRPVILVDVGTEGGQDVAEVKVDGASFTVSEGQRFLKTYQLLSVSGGCARFLYGDLSFTRCKGGASK
jgi:hypothetical protein